MEGAPYIPQAPETNSDKSPEKKSDSPEKDKDSRKSKKDKKEIGKVAVETPEKSRPKNNETVPDNVIDLASKRAEKLAAAAKAEGLAETIPENANPEDIQEQEAKIIVLPQLAKQ